MAGKFGFSSAHSGLNTFDPGSLQFLLFSDEDIRKLSVVKITTSNSFDSLGNATPNGLYDIKMGPTRDRYELCGTCSNNLLDCPGHFGHIELPVVVINPLFIKSIYTLFRMTCLKCYKIQVNSKMRTIMKLQLDLIDVGQVTAALDLENFNGDVVNPKDNTKPSKALKKYYKLLKNADPITELFQSKNVHVLRKRILNNYLKGANVAKNCMFCKAKVVKITTSEGRLMMNNVVDGVKAIKILLPDEIHDHCNKIVQVDEDLITSCIPILKYVNTKPVTDVFFMNNILIPPPSVRPCNVLRGELVEHPQTNTYKHILSASLAMRGMIQVIKAHDPDKAINAFDEKVRSLYDRIPGEAPPEKMHYAWQDLQRAVNEIMCIKRIQKTATCLGLKEIIEKKSGIIRMHMMGKRVNFAARSVITPDPNVDIDEIGVPDAFAKKLTYPVPVTEWNVEELRQMVINGPEIHPGAAKIEMENGRTILIPDCIQKRKSLAKRLLTPDEYKSPGLKVVHRHLINGDLLIMNRQPSLHKPSMMAHRARILKGEKTLRLHYANCKSYNADFDGDEMNAHFPQNEIARSEAAYIMTARKQYLVPKDGTPLSGLIQDHVISGVKMSMRGNFFSKADYQQLVFQALPNHRGEIKLLPPAILKPVVLWSGKQVLSTIIMNNTPKGKPYLSISSSAKIAHHAWQREPPREWKAGGTPFSNPKTMSETEVIIRKGELVSGVLDKTHYGATPYGLIHCMFELYGGESSSALLTSFSKVFTFYLQWAGFTLGVKDILVIDEADKKRNEFICLVRQSGKIAAVKATESPIDVDDQTMKNKIGEMLTKDPKFRTTLDRHYKSMLDEYTNKINKACMSNGLLEKFPYNNLQLMVQSGAKGSTVNTMQISCLLGQIELEGKRPPLMISGKSLPSFDSYDMTPRAGGFIDGRFMTGIQPQEFFFHCMAGREGLIDTAVKTSRSGYLQRCLIKHLEGLSVGYDHTVRDSDGSVVQFAYGEDGLDVLKCQFLKKNQFEFLDINSDAILSKSIINSLKEDTNLKSIAKAHKSVKKWQKKYGSLTSKKRTGSFANFCKNAKNDIFIKTNDDRKYSRDPYYAPLIDKWNAMTDEEKSCYAIKSRPDPVQGQQSPEFKFGVINEQLQGLIQNYLKNRQVTAYSEHTDEDKFEDVLNAKYLASMADPGEPVGLLAAQSIGEPSTQMTLNTFHFAGRGDMNVTLGIPRLREILMTASAKLKTPNMDIPFLDAPDVKTKADKLRLKLNRVTVADVLEKIDVNCKIEANLNRCLKTTIKFSFLPHSQYKSRYSVKPAQIIKFMQNSFFSVMFSTITKLAKSSCGVVWTSERKSKKRKQADDDEEEDAPQPVRAGSSNEDSSDEEIPNEDDDNTDAKLRSKRNEEQEYDDPESEEEEKSDDEEVEDNETPKDDQTTDDAEDTSKVSAKDNRAINQVIQKFEDATNYIFDTKTHQWCELTVMFPVSFLEVDLSQAISEAAHKSVIYQVENIRRAIVDVDKDAVTLRTEGINITKMFQYSDVLNLNRLYSNDVHAIANTYGIEAALKVIIKEIENVFRVYGITVDPRHLSLIADYMTFNGRFEPMSRRGMDASASPLQQMSFESSLVFLKEAVLNAKFDSITSASSCLMLGQPCRSGTGSFSLQLATNVA